MRAIVLWGILAVASVAHAGTPLPDGPHVVTSGEGKLSVAPDMATLRLVVEKRDASPAVTKQQADQAVNRFLDALAKRRVAAADITASDLGLSEDNGRNDAGRRVSNGFVAERSIEVKLRDVKQLDAVLDDALAAGVNHFGDTTFGSSREEALVAQARLLAAQDARHKAEQLARGVSAQVGKVYSIDSTGSSNSARYRGDELGTITVTASKDVPARYLQPQIEFKERVQVVFDLQR
ncbi:SIMPL domain-containing protein [Solilutibacter silvestris]|uniref:DUF541 domain-containing protein n=1 Tax=Solilutibacter silvestris TaxID=1645665 RepID=A0A2K1Q1B3_9GAMM|nr:SIMPL domain-containing protein [Lysobacter silvestris]PNS08826.1 hypothetical protein Lysil_0455 [Lysobacter silvestris]